MAIQEVGSGDTRQKPIKLGGALVTLVEPHRGHEVTYNRWYERDHFYAGCMIGAWTISGARYVATRDHKAVRFPSDSPVVPDPTSGSYVALYWVLAGKFGEWMRWGTDQVNWLHANHRMFEHRDHVHTTMYRFRGEGHADPDGVPVELALDRGYPGLVMMIAEPAEGADAASVIAWATERTPMPADQVAAFIPVPLLADAPKDVPLTPESERVCLLWFCVADPLETWDDFIALGDTLASEGAGRVLFASPFVKTIPGTDTYTDKL
ncbi:MAG: hypothetical protein FJW88_03145 [Actinobacteria bacterium]|nr:hypothetical protein [Actinomycetota bacterium]